MSSCIAPPTCAVGEEYVDGRCVSPDGGTLDAAMLDAGPPCGGACEGATPFCVDGACVSCRDASDCGSALAPVCDAGACVSCEGRSDCTPDQVGEQVAAILCEAAAEAPVAAYPEITDFDLLQNASITAALCSRVSPLFERSIDAIRAGRTTVDVGGFRACLNSVRERGPAYDIVFHIVECRELFFAGTVAEGGACVEGTECLSGACDTSTCPGACVPRVATGEPCVADAQCPDGYCSTTCRTVTIDPPRSRGDACTRSYQCDNDAGEVCVGPAGAMVCGDRPSIGQPCVSDAGGLTCALGLYCDGTACRARVELGMPCVDAASCVAGARCSASTCVAVALPGERCDAGQVCAEGTECTAGVCTVLPNVGEPCRTACLRGTCMGGTCTSLPVGTPCTQQAAAADALDPCGDGTTCGPAGGDYQCFAVGATGERCGAGLGCNEPYDQCLQADTCTPYCTL